MNFEQQIKIWLEQGKIKEQKVKKDQIEVLIKRAQRDTEVSKLNLEIDYDTSFSTAYNSMLKAGRAFILSKGYRTDDGAQHKTTVDFCSFFLDGETNKLIKTFDRMRRIRNIIAYDPFDYAGFEKDDVLSAIESAEKFVKAIEKLLRLSL